MSGLLLAEIRRLTARRAVRILGVAALAIVLLVEVRAFVVSHRRPVAQTFQIDEASAPEFCASLRERGEIPADADCTGDEAKRRVTQYVADHSLGDGRLRARTRLPSGAQAVAVGVAVAGFVVGATYVGAEWNAGTMQALLFWEPRRWRVLLAKALALVGVLVAFTAGLQVVTYALTWLVAATRGTTEGLTAGVHLSALLTMLRGMIVVSASALFAFAVAGLARVTAAALGVAFGYFVILENLIRGQIPGWQRYLFSENVSAVMLKHVEVFGGRDGPAYVLHAGRAVLTIGVYLALLLGAFYVTFERRDVT